MSKKSEEAKEPKTKEETVTKETQPEKNDSLATIPTELANLAALSQDNARFLAKFGERVKRVMETMPKPEDMMATILDMPEDLAAKAEVLMDRFSGNIQGMYTNDTGPDIVQLRLFHGTGNDQNRPERQVPGEFYLSSKETVGPSFTGIVVGMWEGRTMWGSSDGESRGPVAPVCSSMDQVVGSTFGNCADCPYSAWKDGEGSQCKSDVVYYMLNEELTDIVKVQFSKSSYTAGTRLRRFLKHDRSLWKNKYTIKAEPKTHPKDPNKRWYVMTVEKAKNAEVPEKLQELCQQICTSIEGTFILPATAQTYRNAQQATGAPGDVQLGSDDDEENYGGM